MRPRPLALACLIAAWACASCASAEHGSGSIATSASTTTQSSSSAPAPTSTTAGPPTPSATSSATVPPLSAQARAAGLVDVRTVVPDAVIDLRYATSDNFTHVQLYPANARCLVHRTMVDGLVTAAQRLRALGDVLVFWDCYRPHTVQVRMFQVVPNPDWVARPGPYATSHESARSVDVTVARQVAGGNCPQRVHDHCLLDMGTGFDDFTPRAWAFATQGVSSQEQANRAALRHSMNAGGLTVYTGEWWHFDGPGALVRRAILDVPVA